MNLAALIERVEKATDGSQELDAEICLALGYIGYADAPLNLRRSPNDRGWDGWFDYELDEDGRLVDCTDMPPPLTTSVDAALAIADRLYPVGIGVSHELNHTLSRDGEEWWNFRIKTYSHDEGEPPIVHWATDYTAPRAIVLATLRALDARPSP